MRPIRSMPLRPRSLLWLVALGLACGVQAQEAPTTIGALQGRGERSAQVDREVVVEGVVTAKMRTAVGESRDGWFLQDSGDGDPASSDALFVLGANPPKIGDRVRIRGTVVELDAGRGTLTALRPASVTALGPGRLPNAVAISAPPASWEPYENMRVRIAAPLWVAGTHRLERHGELILHFGERPRTPTDAARPGEPARALAAANARRMLRLDDANSLERPTSVWYLPPSGAPRAGSRVAGLQGVLDQRGGDYLLLPETAPKFRESRRPRPPRVGGDVRIASFNLENYFNGDGAEGGFPTPRGARDRIELQAQLGRLIATIRGLDPDIAALMELENDGFGAQSSIAQLVDALNQGDRTGDWRFVASSADPGGDLIRVGLIYRSGRVSTVGEAAGLRDELFGQRSRPPLAQSFRAGDGPVFTVVANHFKSKGCGEAAGAEADQRDGQSCWNPTRVESARRLDAWLRTDPTRSGSDLAMIVGDLNAYSMEDPIQTLIAAGWRDAFDGQSAPYSYVYDALTGRLDHALLSPSLARRLVGAAEWHSNADEPDSRGYQAQPKAAGPWRSSDHDPLVVGFRLRRPD